MKDPYILSTGLLLSWGKILLLGSFGISLLQAMRGELGLTDCFERLSVAMILLLFHDSWAGGLQNLSKELSAALTKLGNEENLRQIILNSFEKASHETSASHSQGFNLPALIEQIFRTGVWGVLSGIVEFIFLLSDLILECGREVLWKLVLILFPLGCGVYPVLPRIMINLCLYLVELALWSPLLIIVRITTGSVAKVYLDRPGSLGLYLVAVELVAILLILSIPAISHKLMHGAFGGDMNSGAGVLAMGRKAVRAASGGVG